MKKILIGILVGILIAGVIVGAGFGINAAVKANKKVEGVKVVETLLEDEYKSGDKAAYKLTLQADDAAITSVKYRIDSGTETSVSNATTGETKDNKKLNVKNGKYYLDTGVQTLELTSLSVGTHVIEFIQYQGETTKIVHTHIFKIVA